MDHVSHLSDPISSHLITILEICTMANLFEFKIAVAKYVATALLKGHISSARSFR